jgi:hypothetical protein
VCRKFQQNFDAVAAGANFQKSSANHANFREQKKFRANSRNSRMNSAWPGGFFSAKFLAGAKAKA